MERKAMKGCLLIGGIVAGAMVFIFIFSMIAAVVAGSGDKIAHLDLTGVITSSLSDSLFGSGESMVDEFVANLKSAVDEDSVKAIVLFINSPGGEITASDTIHHAVEQASDAKPVVVYMDSLAASGGYYVACAADEIVANETTLTGSIGVIIQTLEYVDLFGKVGLESRVFTSGDFKDSLSGSREMRPEEREYIQGLVMEMYERFLDIVAAGRGIEKETLRDGIADGRVISGKDALAQNLVDANGYLEDAYDRARELGEAPGAEVQKFGRETGFAALFASARGLIEMLARQGGADRRVEIDLSNRLLPRLQAGMIYLLPSHYVP